MSLKQKFALLRLNSNSCYMDSLFIFILLYKDTPFFKRFYTPITDVKNISELGNFKNKSENDKQKLIEEIHNLPINFNGIYNAFCNGDNIKIGKYRENIRIALYNIGELYGKRDRSSENNNSKFARNWKTAQQDSSELLELLMKIYDIDTKKNYNIDKCYNYNRTDKTFTSLPIADYKNELKKLNESHIADYISDKYDYHYTIHIAELTQYPIFNEDNKLHQINEPTLDLSQNAHIRLYKQDIINMSRRVKENENINDKLIVVNYNVHKNKPPMLLIHLNRLIKDRRLVEKNTSKIEIPEYINVDDINYKYILLGGTIHHGGSGGGHYTTYILNPADDNYYHYDNCGPKFEKTGDYNKLIKSNFSSLCTQIFYMLFSDYNKQKKNLCVPIIEQLSEKSSNSNYANAAEGPNDLQLPQRIPLPQSIPIKMSNKYNPDKINFILLS